MSRLALSPLGCFFIPSIGADVGIHARTFDHVGIDLQTDALQEVDQADTLDHLTGEMIERIGLVNFLEGVGLEIDPNMIERPRMNPYVRTDGWDEEAAKWAERKAAQ